MGTRTAISRSERLNDEDTARNPRASGKIFSQMTVGLALMESIAIYGFVIAYLALSAVS